MRRGAETCHYLADGNNFRFAERLKLVWDQDIINIFLHVLSLFGERRWVDSGACWKARNAVKCRIHVFQCVQRKFNAYWHDWLKWLIWRQNKMKLMDYDGVCLEASWFGEEMASGVSNWASPPQAYSMFGGDRWQNLVAQWRYTIGCLFPSLQHEAFTSAWTKTEI